MKRLLYIISAIILFSTESYYYTYLKYPESVDVLIDYIWEQLNGVNDYRFSSFEEHLNTYEKDEFKPLEDVLSFLIKEKEKISILVEDTFFMLKYRENVKCKEDALRVRMTRNYCKDKDAQIWESRFENHRFKAFDSTGKAIAIRKNHEYEEEYFALATSVRKKYSKCYTTTDNDGDSITRYWLLKYTRNGKIYSLCENDIDLYSNSYIKELAHSLDSLLNEHKEIEEMHFITSIFYE